MQSPPSRTNWRTVALGEATSTVQAINYQLSTVKYQLSTINSLIVFESIFESFENAPPIV